MYVCLCDRTRLLIHSSQHTIMDGCSRLPNPSSENRVLLNDDAFYWNALHTILSTTVFCLDQGLGWTNNIHTCLRSWPHNFETFQNIQTGVPQTELETVVIFFLYNEICDPMNTHCMIRWNDRIDVRLFECSISNHLINHKNIQMNSPFPSYWNKIINLSSLSYVIRLLTWEYFIWMGTATA